MALKLKYTDEHGILHINMSPTSTPRDDLVTAPPDPAYIDDNYLSVPADMTQCVTPERDLKDPQFDSINNRFGSYDIFGGKYDAPSDGSGEDIGKSLFRTRYNSIEEELANTPYAFTTERTLRDNLFDIQIKTRALDHSPSKDIEDDRFFRNLHTETDIFGPNVDFETTLKSSEETPAFTVTQLIHAQDRYFDLSSRQQTTKIVDNSEKINNRVKSLTKKFEVRSAPGSSKNRTVKIVDSVQKEVAKKKDEAFKVLSKETPVLKAATVEREATLPILPTSKRRREQSFVIVGDVPSRPSTPHSLPVDVRQGRTSPFKGRGFRESTSRHTTPRTSASNSRANSPPRRRTSSLSRIDTMTSLATLPPPVHIRPHSPRNFVRENIEEIRELSELNREKHEAEAEMRRKDEEEALLKEMEMFERGTGSKATSRANSPSKRLRSRSNSPSVVLNAAASVDSLTKAVGGKPVTHKSRVRTTSKSQPQSNNGSPNHSKIPKRQNSVSPSRPLTKRPFENNLNKNQRFISNSTSSIHETIKIGSSVHDRRVMSKSTAHLNISPSLLRGKPPISPGKAGPPPSNRAINPKRLSPIVGTPNKSPIEDSKPNSAAKSKTSTPKKPVKPANSTLTSRTTSKQPSRAASREPSPDKRKGTLPRTMQSKPVGRTPSTKAPSKPAPKPEPKKTVTRTSSIKNLTRVPSTKNLSDKTGTLKKHNSKKDLTDTKSQASSKMNGANTKPADMKSDVKESGTKKGDNVKETKTEETNTKETPTDSVEEVTMQDNETQYDKITNEKGDLVVMTKKNVVSMTTAAIASQPLEVVTTVTNQLPAALEKAREKGIFERHSSKDSLVPKTDDKTEATEVIEERKPKPRTIMTDDNNVRLKPLQPPYNNPQVERVKQKIDDILKAPEVSAENILAAATTEAKEYKSTLRTFAEKTSQEIKQRKDEAANKLTELKDQAVKQNAKNAEEIRAEALKIVNSIMTPVEEPAKETKEEIKKTIEPIVTVVNEKKNGGKDIVQTTEALVKGDGDIEVQSSNLSTPKRDRMAMQGKMADGASEKSSQSNGGFPQSTSTTPKPPARQNRGKASPESENKTLISKDNTPEPSDQPKKENICKRILNKCADRTKCCACCIKPQDDENDDKMAAEKQNGVEKKDGVEMAGKKGVFSKLNCCKKKEQKEQEVKEQMVKEIEKAAGKTSLSFEDESPRTWRDALCCRGRAGRVGAAETGEGARSCWGRQRPRPDERRDSILSDRPVESWCTRIMKCRCLRRPPAPVSRRPSMFSKNKSLSPTLPPEDTRPKLDPSLIEHSSRMRAAIPALPVPLAALCLLFNVLAPGLGTVFSGLFCLCFGVPRFGAHDGAKQRIGAFIINILVGCGQLFTVLFCLVGWGWAIWWGVIMLRLARKYKKLKQEAAAAAAAAAAEEGTNETQQTA